ncbi:uncharacterized protein LOC123673381 [Harmonia axyridis]|uniref:uncharacterized protein LOC123673381 n=1 Tax=Harmonia axyridis TaxID=115357 RepID=UPI001E274E64|nr:uncharacterized protein LOC123673381 [Harmonia axyridis]
MKKNSTPGKDGIDYLMLHHLPPSARILLLRFFNQLLQEGNPPSCMKTSFIVPVPKKNCPANVSTSYRPITITPCITKIFERMVKERIEKSIEEQLNRALTFGFRRGRSISDCHTLLTGHIYRAFNRKQFTLVIFLDVSNAYDCVDLGILWQDLLDVGIHRNLCNLIYQLYRHRSVVITGSSGTEFRKNVTNGLIQGSPLSPLLFLLYSLCPPNLLAHSVHLIQYADDFALLCSGKNVNQMVDLINTCLIGLNNWLRARNLKINALKSAAIIFSKSIIPINVNPITIGSQTIEWKSQVKYLGVTFDQKLKWGKHIDHMCDKAISQSKIIKSLCRPSWGSHPSTLLNVYRGLVRPHLDFGGILYGRCAKMQLLKLDRVQFSVIRTALGLMRSSPTNVILAESGELPLQSRRLWLALKYVTKIFRFSNHPLLQVIGDPSELEDLWFNGTIPGYIEACKVLKNRRKLIWSAQYLPYFLTEIKILTDKFSGYTDIYTDASKSRDPDSVGYGVWIPTRAVKVCGRLPDHWSVYTAETYAICRAVQMIIDRNLTRAVIISDALGVLNKLKHGNINANIDIVTVNTLILLARARSLGMRVALMWIPPLISNESTIKDIIEMAEEWSKKFPQSNDIILKTKIGYLLKTNKDKKEVVEALEDMMKKKIITKFNETKPYNKPKERNEPQKTFSVVIAGIEICHCKETLLLIIIGIMSEEGVSDIDKRAAEVGEELLPPKSRKLYEQQYDAFKKWCRLKNVRQPTENVLKYLPST